ncbi:MAG: hypothetical protein IJG13_14350 [Kiritimatiellae bacterium]|nr:hypothetical protein [Kiritimatiellia bacterium]MBQ6328709.1 hypothetical protein [Kiritimatiellia bacterium]
MFTSCGTLNDVRAGLLHQQFAVFDMSAIRHLYLRDGLLYAVHRVAHHVVDAADLRVGSQPAPVVAVREVVDLNRYECL